MSADQQNPGNRLDYEASSSDELLITACISGDQEAWQLLVSRYNRLVYSIPRRYGMPQDAAEDVAQDVFTILFRRLAGIERASALPKWLMTTTHRSCCQWIRRNRKPTEDYPESLRTDEPQEEMAEKWERQHLVRKALRELGGKCQELLTALYMNTTEISYKEVASQLEIPVGSVGPTRARCIEKLLSLLEGIAEDGQFDD